MFVFSSPPASLMAILSTCEELCDSILAAVQVGEFAVVQPFSVEYSCILGYLLAWKLLLTFFKSSPSHVSHERSWLCIIRYLHNMLFLTFSFSIQEYIRSSRFINSLERVDFAVCNVDLRWLSQYWLLVWFIYSCVPIMPSIWREAVPLISSSFTSSNWCLRTLSTQAKGQRRRRPKPSLQKANLWLLTVRTHLTLFLYTSLKCKRG